MANKVWTLEPRRCRKCGKEIYITPEWVYKDGWGVYCTWKCFNHRFDGIKRNTTDNSDKKDLAGVPKRGGFSYKKVEQLKQDGTVVEVHDSAYDAAVAVDGWTASIYDACRLGKKYKKHLWRYVAEKEEKDDDRGMESDIRETPTNSD